MKVESAEGDVGEWGGEDERGEDDPSTENVRKERREGGRATGRWGKVTAGKEEGGGDQG